MYTAKPCTPRKPIQNEETQQKIDAHADLCLNSSQAECFSRCTCMRHTAGNVRGIEMAHAFLLRKKGRMRFDQAMECKGQVRTNKQCSLKRHLQQGLK